MLTNPATNTAIQTRVNQSLLESIFNFFYVRFCITTTFAKHEMHIAFASIHKMFEDERARTKEPFKTKSTCESTRRPPGRLLLLWPPRAWENSGLLLRTKLPAVLNPRLLLMAAPLLLEGRVATRALLEVHNSEAREATAIAAQLATQSSES